MKDEYIRIEELDKNDNILDYIDTIFEEKVGESNDIKNNDWWTFWFG